MAEDDRERIPPELRDLIERFNEGVEADRADPRTPQTPEERQACRIHKELRRQGQAAYNTVPPGFRRDRYGLEGPPLEDVDPEKMAQNIGPEALAEVLRRHGVQADAGNAQERYNHLPMPPDACPRGPGM